MSTTQKISSDLEAKYLALDPPQKAMVRILAINVEPCATKRVLNCLKDLGFTCHATNAPYRAQDVQPLLKELVSKGLLDKSNKGLACPDSIRQTVVRDCLAHNEFSRIAEAVQTHMMDGRAPYQTYLTHYKQYARSMQMALFHGNSIEEVYSVLDKVDRYLPDTPPEESIFLHLLARPFSPQVIEAIKPEMRLSVLGLLLHATKIRLEPAGELIDYIQSSFGDSLYNKPESISLIDYFLLCGKTDNARALIEKLPQKGELERLSRTGWLSFLNGQYEEARTYFAENLQLFKKMSRKKKVFFQNEVGLIHLLSLLEGNDSTLLHQGIEYIDIVIKNHYRYAPLAETMKSVFQQQLGLDDTDTYRGALNIFDDNPLQFLIFMLILSWTDKAKVKGENAYLADIRDKAKKNGYLWLAAELSSLLAELNINKNSNTNQAKELHSSCGTTTCIGLVRKVPQWEKKLNGLLSLSDPSISQPVSAEQRLIWLFKYRPHSHSCSLTPKLQKITKKGTWTKGRQVGLKNLHNNHLTLDGLTDQDHRICQAIHQEYYSSGWYGYSSEYEFNYDQALPALVGHPLLFLEDKPDIQVELVLSEPKLEINEEKGKLRLALSPPPPSAQDETTKLIKDTPTRFKLYRFTEQHREIGKYLGKGMSIPKSGAKKAQQVVESLSSMVTVLSDLDGATEAETREADSRPHAHILPCHDGVQVEFLVKPCGDEGSSFRAGRGSKNVLTEIDGKKIQTVRDFAEEKKQLNDIISACPTLNRIKPVDNQWQVEDPEYALELLLELKNCDEALILEWPQGEKFSVRKETPSTAFSLQIKKERDWFKATGSLEINDELSLDLQKLLSMLDQGTGRFIQLDDGTFLSITKALRKRLEDLAAFSEKHGKGVRFSPLAALALDDLTEEAGQVKSDKAWKQHCKQLKEVVQPEVPGTLQAGLRDYQKQGFHWLAQLSHWEVGGCLADDMGLGKTVQALAAILLRAAQGPTLVVAPLSVTSNWVEEARRFAPTLNVLLFGSGNRQEMIDNLQPFDLVIVSYGLLPLEAELLTEPDWQTVVLDEAQAIKNMQTKRSKAAMQLKAQFRLITTGTPVENHLGELWTLFHFLNPGLLGPFKRFQERFAGPIERDQDGAARSRLRKLIRPFILRRLKSDVLQELPPKTEINLEVEMSKDELVLYEAQRIKALENISNHADDEGAGQQHLRILAEIMKLRRLCCNPSLVLPDCGISSSKLKVFADTLEELLSNNHKALIFSQFVDHLQIIREFLETKGISYQYLDGSTPVKKRKERIASFQNGEGDVFLISLKAGGAGLNLTAADYVIHMDPWWNPAVEDQASDRAHRIGQERPVTVYRLVVKDSIEEQIVALHKEKRDLADSLLEGTDSAGKISAKELLGLLQGHQ
ncbi:MAG: DEAD/DEAH box helicase [Candidatus Electrothrix scaldis]|nr:MAG: DEAD/DEAH box helicase [Candidatus Electrothrix sp. GW3-3]